MSALVNIRRNGVNDIRNLDTFGYTKQFVREHSRADDAARMAPTSVSDEEDFFLVPFDPEYNSERGDGDNTN